MFTIEVFNDKVLYITESFSYSLIILLIYVIISKQEPLFFFLSIMLLFIIYIINKQKDMLNNDIKQESEDKDKDTELKKTINILDNTNTILRYITAR